MEKAKVYLEEDKEDRMLEWFKQASDKRKNWHLKT